MSIGSAAAAQSSTANSTNSSSSANSNDPLASLSGNFSDFLQMLMTQLQNQDPTSPMDTSQFTSELVQFTGVEQQINMNNNLTQLIQLTQGSEMLQSSSIVGKQVQVTSPQMPLQNGSGKVDFTMPAAGPVSLTVYDSTGAAVRNVSLDASAGANSWSWDGTSDSGSSLPDGAYKVAITSANADGTTSSVPFTVEGTVTGVQSQNNSVGVELGSLDVNFSNIQQVLN
jgi:flagellar basal-body rod modification protein FlgD